jgi:hypothetical protein
MKTTRTSKTFLLGMLILAGSGLFAQSAGTGKPAAGDEKKYRLYLVKDENGNKEVIDKTFSSKEEMDKYIEQNKIEVPEVSEAPVPPTPPTPPCPAANTKTHGDKTDEKGCDQKQKKIIIIEKEEGSNQGQPSLEITYQNLSAEERAAIIQELLNQKGKEVQIVHQQKTVGPVKS